MSAMTDIPKFFPTEFGTNWEHLLQQKISKLKTYVSIETVRGKEKKMNQLGPVEMTKVTVRAGDTRITDTPTDARWLRPYPYDKADLFDEWDETFLGEVVLPTSEVVQAHAMAYARACDRIIVDAALGTAFTGETGTNPVSLPGSQEIAANYVETGSPAASGLTIAKLRQAKFLMDAADVDDEDQKIIACSAKQIQDLLRTTEVTSADFNNVKALVAGQIDTFMGFKFVRINSAFFPYVANTDVRTIVAYAKSGIKLADSGRKVHMDVRSDKSHSLQIRTVAALGGTRTQEKKVVRILCDESPA